MPHTTRVLRSEWTKIRSVRSTLWTLATALVVTVGLSALICAFTASQFDKLSKQQQLTFDATQTSFSGSGLGQLAMIAFGVMVVSSEYSTGMIRSSLAAVPQRTVFLLTKVFVATSLVLVVGMATSFSAFFVGQALLGEHAVSIQDEGVLRAVLGGGVYMTLIALFSMGLSFVLRSPLLAFAILMPFFFLISNILGTVSATKKYAQYLPDQAGKTITAVVPESLNRPYGPYEGLAIMAAWALAALVVGWIVLKRRDA
ncbi:ABC-type transport system involved in multi-copper enzyme maturation permease subunit [Streptomyces sp. Amel2xB2]|uniref:ABC transporter n=1 Tax=Streptomyces nanshensis TaxID=518642 RepID=A0A1E7L6L5_9ACTN|nr:MULTISPECIES: ABC transporter permease subunit [Streptomyces]OEV11751.1 ABC transporter [Streptomyces nanshensis]RAJ63292.1 ABC-type transport system involved in multi-copper enzyme maturation permease subunit [Streptomyces sp. Amel2xB2]